MFNMGTMLVHPTYGVCEVVCIDKISMKNVKDERLFYTLVPLYDKKSKLFIPIESENIGLRPIMTKEDAMKLVQSLPAMDSIDVPNEKVREQLFKEMIRGGDCKELSQIIKTLYMRNKERQAAGKKKMSLDEKYLVIAREQLYGELAVSLGIKKEEVEDYITRSIEDK